MAESKDLREGVAGVVSESGKNRIRRVGQRSTARFVSQFFLLTKGGHFRSFAAIAQVCISGNHRKTAVRQCGGQPVLDDTGEAPSGEQKDRPVKLDTAHGQVVESGRKFHIGVPA